MVAVYGVCCALIYNGDLVFMAGHWLVPPWVNYEITLLVLMPLMAGAALAIRAKARPSESALFRALAQFLSIVVALMLVDFLGWLVTEFNGVIFILEAIAFGPVFLFIAVWTWFSVSRKRVET
jgi:undecaprenyl pyrophosphate phosphatase UppP